MIILKANHDLLIYCPLSDYVKPKGSFLLAEKQHQNKNSQTYSCLRCVWCDFISLNIIALILQRFHEHIGVMSCTKRANCL